MLISPTNGGWNKKWQVVRKCQNVEQGRRNTIELDAELRAQGAYPFLLRKAHPITLTTNKRHYWWKTTYGIICHMVPPEVVSRYIIPRRSFTSPNS